MQKPLEVNTSLSRGCADVLHEIILKNNWREVQGNRGKLIWYGLAIKPEDLESSNRKIVNRIPGLEETSHKRPLGELLKFTHKYFPEHFNIFPRTFLLPEDFEELEELTKNKSSYFIVKPTSGSQGEGIFIINKARDLQNCALKNWSDLVVQEYLHPPLLLRQKKFDLRIYALITCIDPLCVFINEEGLARFCTEDYEAPNNSNISNAFMHLTNYSLNKRSTKFVHTDEITEVNEGSKQTLQSFYAELEQNGYPVDVIKRNIKDLVVKTLLAIQPAMNLQLKSYLKLAKVEKLRYFHILGVDVLLTQDCRAWLLEINANPSLRIDFEQEVKPGVMQSFPSELDRYVKTKVVEDAIKIAVMKKREQIALDQFESYERIIPGNGELGECSDVLMKIFHVFSGLTDIKNPSVVPLGKFRKIFQKVRGRLAKEIVSADFDIIYIKILKKFGCNQMGYVSFVSAIEEIASKFLNGTSKENLVYVLNLIA
jgi:tubulin polyglutamylase TTLL11